MIPFGCYRNLLLIIITFFPKLSLQFPDIIEGLGSFAPEITKQGTGPLCTGDQQTPHAETQVSCALLSPLTFQMSTCSTPWKSHEPEQSSVGFHLCAQSLDESYYLASAVCKCRSQGHVKQVFPPPPIYSMHVNFSGIQKSFLHEHRLKEKNRCVHRRAKLPERKNYLLIPLT